MKVQPYVLYTSRNHCSEMWSRFGRPSLLMGLRLPVEPCARVHRVFTRMALSSSEFADSSSPMFKAKSVKIKAKTSKSAKVEGMERIAKAMARSDLSISRRFSSSYDILENGKGVFVLKRRIDSRIVWSLVRAAEDWVMEGRVRVNGELLSSPAVVVGPEDSILVDGKALTFSSAVRTVVYVAHKVAGEFAWEEHPTKPTLMGRLRGSSKGPSFHRSKNFPKEWYCAFVFVAGLNCEIALSWLFLVFGGEWERC